MLNNAFSNLVKAKKSPAEAYKSIVNYLPKKTLGKNIWHTRSSAMTPPWLNVSISKFIHPDGPIKMMPAPWLHLVQIDFSLLNKGKGKGKGKDKPAPGAGSAAGSRAGSAAGSSRAGSAAGRTTSGRAGE